MFNKNIKPPVKEIVCCRCGQGYGTLVEENGKYKHNGRCPKIEMLNRADRRKLKRQKNKEMV